ncbi:MAG: DMT family transporter [Actinomycetota bacterium]|nr:DMT family transporter [Actinomycetota bacterium]
MSHALTVFWVAAVGIQLAAQAPINNGLGRTVGKLPAALVSFLTGLAMILLFCLVSGEFGRLASIGQAPVIAWFPGLIGAAWVAVATLTISRIGAGAVAAATITGQLTCSLFVDNFGWVGVDTIPITGLRVAGALMLLVGTITIVYRRQQASGGDGVARTDILAMLVMIAIGVLVGFQHPLNSELADSIGGPDAALMNFVTGTVLLASIVVVSGKLGQVRRVTRVRWYYLLGGLIGLITVLTALTAVDTIGAAGLTAALVTGQLLSSVVLDRFGAFGLERRRVTPVRLLGVVLLVTGTFMTVS